MPSLIKTTYKTVMKNIRIGHGYDIHRLEKMDNKKYLRLGGVNIPHEKSLVAHSDGDVIIHAICDALLGAASLGDIGHFFPDSDKTWANIDSIHLLENVFSKLIKLNFKVSNIDVTVIAEVPKLAPYLKEMRDNISRCLSLSINQVSIKATTHERLDAIGNKDAIASHAVVLIYQI